MMINRKLAAPLALAALVMCAPVVAQVVTFDFTATATGGTGIYEPIPFASELTGTFTIDYAAATTTTGTPGSFATGWDWIEASQQLAAVPAVFNSTAEVAGFSFSAATTNDYTSEVKGATAGSGFQASGSNSASGTAQAGSLIDIFCVTCESSTYVYTTAGYPIFPSSTEDAGYGHFETDNGVNEVQFIVRSVSQVSSVPEPSSYALMLSGIVLSALWLHTGAAKKRRAPAGIAPSSPLA